MLQGSRQLVSDLLATSWACRACLQQVVGKLATFRPCGLRTCRDGLVRHDALVEFDEQDKQRNGQSGQHMEMTSLLFLAQTGYGEVGD